MTATGPQRDGCAPVALPLPGEPGLSVSPGGGPGPGSSPTPAAGLGGPAAGPSLDPFEGMVRPWYRGEEGDHLYADCDDLSGEPVEGVGWLDPRRGDVCFSCLDRYAPDGLDDGEDDWEGIDADD